MADDDREWERQAAVRERARIEGVVRIEGRLAPRRLQELHETDPATYAELEASGVVDRDPLLAGQLAAMALRRLNVTPELWQETCRDVKLFSNRRRLSDAGVPQELARTVLEGADARGRAVEERQPFVDLVRRLEEGARIVVLAGVAGTGKSIAAAQWILKAGGSWVSGEFVASINLKMSTDRDVYQDLQRPRTNLVIDDLAIADGGPVDSLLVRRFDAGAVTVATMNVPHRGGADRESEVRSAVAKVAGERTRSRIRSDGGLVICDEPMRGVTPPTKE
jgi:hypothetical protein